MVNLSFSFRTPSTSSYLLFIFFLLVSCLFAKKKKNKHPKKQERRRRRQKTTNRGNENEWSVGCFLFIFIICNADKIYFQKALWKRCYVLSNIFCKGKEKMKYNKNKFSKQKEWISIREQERYQPIYNLWRQHVFENLFFFFISNSCYISFSF